MASLCGVCNTGTPKYKCPNCKLRYCSLACFTTHKTLHEQNGHSPTKLTSQAINFSTQSAQSLPQQPTSDLPQNPQQDTNTLLLSHPSFNSLFAKYPLLRGQLKQIYATGQPPPTDSSNPSSDPTFPSSDPAFPPSSPPSNNRYNNRGSRRGGRGGRGGHKTSRVWKPEWGQHNAMKLFRRLEEQEGGEGLREFKTLVMMVEEGARSEEGGGETTEAEKG
ncbi:hypothetical protein K402DRAFT_400226 [Aulographum hederae CBS 113979]|uniref:HIT-type domain-containing protein n=1 Tax=Aulographum hederae CBS 113979 TaxID=1176131 RepID=A0A6G1HE42_9PEZI|nr:hypothetical protein K402DRAFT_400226 [Aulographum hederae CBS 113979]